MCLIPLAGPGVGRLPVRTPRPGQGVALADALRHLYVLLPVLDDAKHDWVAPDEVGKLLRAGEGSALESEPVDPRL